MLLPTDLLPYMQPADEEEQKFVARILNRGKVALALPEPIGDVARQVHSNSHWITWRPDGLDALLVQIKPQKGQTAATPPPLFIVVAQGDAQRVYRLRSQGTNVAVRAFSSADWTWPTTVLQGVVAFRAVNLASAEYEKARSQTLASLLMGGLDSSNNPGNGSKLVFFARECLWWRTPRANTDDLQTRMVTARTIIEGDAGETPAMQQGTDGTNGLSVTVVYQPHMAPSQAAVIIRDIPPPLVGAKLAGIELRPTEESSAPWLLITGNLDAYEQAIHRLWSVPA